MKILIYTSHRTGSTALANFLMIEYDCDYYRRFHYNTNDEFDKIVNLKSDGIYKVCPEEDSYKRIKSMFDKRIVLIRENTKEQAESRLYSEIKEKKFSAYSISNDFLNSNKQEIREMENKIISENAEFKKLIECLHLTYEELFYSKEGLKKIEDYLGFESKFEIGSKRYRNMKKQLI
jgi:hypothetical protein